MISVEGLKVEFGVKPLFHDVSFVINDRDRIALVGKNGAGKFYDAQDSPAVCRNLLLALWLFLTKPLSAICHR